jgi:HPt (histidine-containing phosphotransfer) domain-containing protein
VAAQETPGIALQQGLVIWRDAAVYKKFLRRFAEEYATVPARLAGLERAQAAALLHKFKGAAASMAMPELAARAAALEQMPPASQDVRDGIAALQVAIDTVLQTIRRYAPQEEPAERDATHPQGETQ